MLKCNWIGFDNMENIFYELIEEAKDGKVIIDGESWPIAFNTIIFEENKNLTNENNLSTLEIRDKELFFQELEEYINLEKEINRKGFNNNIKLLMAYLFVNATTEDFSNPIKLIRRNILFLKDNTFKNLNKVININNDYKIKIVSNLQNVFMETPNKIEISIVHNKEEFEYRLPTISYGITNENDKKECYVYSILNPKNKKDLTEEEIKFNKKINRLLYKINGGVNEYEIKDVSPSAVLSLLIFFNILEQNNIYNIKAVPYLPLRYLSRDIFALSEDNKERSKELIDRNNFIQTNITNKFINTFIRVIYHMRSANVTSYPYEEDEFLGVCLKDSKVINNNFLENITSSLNK